MVPIDLPQIAAGLNDTKVCLTARTGSGGGVIQGNCGMRLFSFQV